MELSVKQLKLILQANCINYKGCVEKSELVERLVRLWKAKEEEKIRLATIAQTGSLGMCTTCTERRCKAELLHNVYLA